MVSRLEGFFYSIYAYFCRNNKCYAKMQMLVDLMETNGNKIVRNVKTHWISMKSLAAYIVCEYYTLLVKMTIAHGH